MSTGEDQEQQQHHRNQDHPNDPLYGHVADSIDDIDTITAHRKSLQDDKKQQHKHSGLNYDTSVVMQFGRTSSHEFTCDVTHPLSILQAFSVALSSLDSKLACE